MSKKAHFDDGYNNKNKPAAIINLFPALLKQTW